MAQRSQPVVKNTTQNNKLGRLLQTQEKDAKLLICHYLIRGGGGKVDLGSPFSNPAGAENAKLADYWKSLRIQSWSLTLYSDPGEHKVDLGSVIFNLEGHKRPKL